MFDNEIIQLGFYAAHRYGLLSLSLVLMALVLELVRRGRLKERYALLWLATSAASLFIGIFPSIIVKISNILHFQYLTLVYILSFLFLLLMVLIFTIVVSRLGEHNRVLAQEVALLSQRLKIIESSDA